MTKFFTRFDHAVSGLEFKQPSKTEQSHRNECDINCIMNRYKRTGVLGPDHQLRQGYFGDVSSVGSYEEFQQSLANAERTFVQLPAETRAAFGNSVSRFLDEFSDSSKLDKFVKLGLVKASVSSVGTQANPADVTDLKGGNAAVKETAANVIAE